VCLRACLRACLPVCLPDWVPACLPACREHARYLPLVAVYYASGGLGYIMSILTAPEVSQLVGVISVFSFAMFSGGLPVLVQLETRLPPFCYLSWVSYMRYGLEAFYVAEAQHWTQVRGRACVPLRAARTGRLLRCGRPCMPGRRNQFSAVGFLTLAALPVPMFM
jgi:hypothetical protein